MKTKKEIESGLANFTGSEHFHRWSPLFRKHTLSDGVKWLCEAADSFWLADAIASHHGKCMKDPMLRYMQFWTLTVHPDKSATLTCDRDEGDTAFTQAIPLTDFPLETIRIWVGAQGEGEFSIFLPSEY
jgi:hypothetical protein